MKPIDLAIIALLVGPTALSPFVLNGAAAQSVMTYHGSADRSGLYVDSALTPATAATVHLDSGFHAAVDGAVYGQPLYWAPSRAIIVTTEKNFVYALNATTGAEIWKTHLGTPVPLNALPCGNINPMGITGTPTIDGSTGTVYLEAYIKTANGPRHQVFGLSVATGHPKSGWPVDVESGLATLGHGFSNKPQGQRSALALVNGKLYVPYAGHYGDCGTYNGIVVGFNLANPGIFGAWSTEIDGGGSWAQSGIAFDGIDMFVTTGNTFSATNTAWGGGEAVIRLPQSLANPTSTADYFAPANWHALDVADLDLGGTAAIPITVSSAPRVLALGKDGNAYLLNRDNLGGIGHPIAIAHVSSEKVRSALATYPTATAAMVAFNGDGANCPGSSSGNLVMLQVTPSAVSTAWCASFHGDGLPIITTTGGQANPIVWVIGGRDSGPHPSPGDGKLYAFSGSNGQLIASIAGGRAAIGPFQTLLNANSRFYVGASGTVYAFKY
jgi:hypothetical protein